MINHPTLWGTSLPLTHQLAIDLRPYVALEWSANLAFEPTLGVTTVADIICASLTFSLVAPMTLIGAAWLIAALVFLNIFALYEWISLKICKVS